MLFFHAVWYSASPLSLSHCTPRYCTPRYSYTPLPLNVLAREQKKIQSVCCYICVTFVITILTSSTLHYVPQQSIMYHYSPAMSISDICCLMECNCLITIHVYRLVRPIDGATTWLFGNGRCLYQMIGGSLAKWLTIMCLQWHWHGVSLTKIVVQA